MAQLGQIEPKKIDILELIKTSPTLDDAKKAEWTEKAKKLNPEQLKALAQIFLDERKQYNAIIEKANKKKLEIQKAYLEKIKIYKEEKMKELMHKKEEKQHDVDMAEADSLLNDLD